MWQKKTSCEAYTQTFLRIRAFSFWEDLIDAFLCLEHRQVILLNFWILVLGMWAGLCKLEHAETCWMGEAYGDVSNSNQTPQMKKVFWTGTRESVVLCVCVCVCVRWGGFETLPHHLYRETLPGFLHLANPVASPNKQEHILTFHSFVLHQEITFPCTVGKQGFFIIGRNTESLFFPWHLQIPVPRSCSQCQNPTVFCVPYYTSMLMV